MKVKIYRHIKSGKLYSLVQSKFMGKIEVIGPDPENEGYNLLEWNRSLVLYKSEYLNSDGPYFCRFRSDFDRSFEFIGEFNSIVWRLIKFMKWIK